MTKAQVSILYVPLCGPDSAQNKTEFCGEERSERGGGRGNPNQTPSPHVPVCPELALSSVFRDGAAALPPELLFANHPGP